MPERLRSLNGWLVCNEPRPGAQVRLVAIPGAGSGPESFRGWAPALPPWLETWLVSAPGRGHRVGEPVPSRLAAHVDSIATAMEEWDPTATVLLGHSMGALVALDLARHEVARGKPPLAVFVSALRAPSVTRSRRDHLLADDELLATARSRFGGFPSEIDQYPELREMALGILRRDLRALETHPIRSGPQLSVPLRVMGGASDPAVSREELEAWGLESTLPTSVTLFPGNHRYIESARVEVIEWLQGQLKELARGEKNA
jgi:pyochelin biosynthetic protein PchC